MSRLRFPFRSQQSSNQVNGGGPIIPLTQKEIANAEYWNHVDDTTNPGYKGKAKEVERLWGLENFGNTCYCNSVLQALYACQPFREFVESYPSIPPPISALAPPPGTANQPHITPSSPLASTRGNPFDNPALTNGAFATPEKDKAKRGLFGRRPTSQAGAPSLATIQQNIPTTPLTPPAATNANLEIPAVPVDPNQPPPSVFQTIQTLFAHLSTSAPHQPLPSRKPAKDDAANAQTASLLPADGVTPTGPQPSLTTSSGPAGAKVVSPEPQGPPLLASLPPPSAPRGGGPFQAGSLGRGVVRPEDLLKTVKRENEMFRGMSQQDAHEFLGWVLNKVAEDVQTVDRKLREAGQEVTEAKGHGQTFVQNLFEGVLTNETRCLSCEMVSGYILALADM
jgi:ubiquitin carboxyl-terminal hydrolase 9/13